MPGFLKRLFSVFSGPKPAGPPRLITKIDRKINLISDKATWVEGAIVLQGGDNETARLIELPLDRLEQCILGLRFQMSSSDVTGKGAYPEIWVTVDGFGEAFSKGLNYRLKGSNDWSSCELPFYLRKNQPATRLKLNLVFEGSGSVVLRDIELYATPLE